MAENKLLRVLGLKESISMTIGTVVGVGLFTCGSSQIGLVGSWIYRFHVCITPCKYLAVSYIWRNVSCVARGRRYIQLC